MNISYVVFVNEKPVLKKKFQENSPKKNTSVEKMNNLERFYSIQKQPPKVLC